MKRDYPRQILSPGAGSMSNRVSKVVLLCEDEAHSRLFRAYLKQVGIPNIDRIMTAEVASQKVHGGNVGWVLDHFPRELYACRKRQTEAETLLVVMIDADEGTVEDRRKQLDNRARREKMEPLSTDDPTLALLIPKRNVETWIRSLLGESATEIEDYKQGKKSTPSQYNDAARTLYAWSRPNATPGITCTMSLGVSLSDWHRIGNRLK